MLYLTSDTHFYHTNIIKYTNRPFSSTEEMNETLIANWNSRISLHDDVFFLGDFAFAGTLKIEKLLAQLNGKITLIKGNHDLVISNKRWLEMGIYEVHNSIEIKYKGVDLLLCHYPFLNKEDFDQRKPELRPVDTGKTLLCGHRHSKPEEKIRLTSNGTIMYDVGVDANKYSPISIEEVLTGVESFRDNFVGIISK